PRLVGEVPRRSLIRPLPPCSVGRTLRLILPGRTPRPIPRMTQGSVSRRPHERRRRTMQPNPRSTSKGGLEVRCDRCGGTASVRKGRDFFCTAGRGGGGRSVGGWG